MGEKALASPMTTPVNLPAKILPAERLRFHDPRDGDLQQPQGLGLERRGAVVRPDALRQLPLRLHELPLQRDGGQVGVRRESDPRGLYLKWWWGGGGLPLRGRLSRELGSSRSPSPALYAHGVLTWADHLHARPLDNHQAPGDLGSYFSYLASRKGSLILFLVEFL